MFTALCWDNENARIVPEIKPETYDTFIKNAVGGTKARKETKQGKLSDEANVLRDKIEGISDEHEPPLQILKSANKTYPTFTPCASRR